MKTEPFFSLRTLTIGFTVLFLLAYVLFDGPFGYSSICTQCGMRRFSRDWFVPFTPLKVGTVNAEAATPLSTVLHEKQIVPAHTHRWLFIHGAGHGAMCAIGNGSRLLNATNEKAACTIAVLHDCGQFAFRDRLLAGLLNPDTCGLYRSATYIPPLETFTDAELQRWMEKQSQEIDDLLRVR